MTVHFSRKVDFSADQDGVFKASLLELRGVRPAINGVPAARWAGAWDQTSPGRWERSGGLQPAGGVFSMLIEEIQEGVLALRYWLEGFPPGELESFGVQLEQVLGLRAYLRSGYTSWDGSFYVEPGALPAMPQPPGEGLRKGLERLSKGFALTQLLPEGGSGSLVIGFERHDRFQHTFTFSLEPGSLVSEPVSLTVLTLWDRKIPGLGERIESERLLIYAHPEVEGALRLWARFVARASPLPPRPPDQPVIGWCSWYNLYAAIDAENIREHLRATAEAAHREALPMRVFQIDDGFTPEMGDWLETKPKFPGGMKPLLDEIREAGFIPGLWIAPFTVGNRSRLYREHPDWVVRDAITGGPLAEMRFYGEFRWHKRSEEYYILDVTHPQAFEYIREVFRIWRWEWGCEYFKTDFMYFGSEYGPERAIYHTPGLTRIEIWRKMAEMIREEIGEAFWLGCGCPLWASVGLVDAIRTGKDVGVEWKQGAGALLEDLAARNFANGILWASDPDCILLRERFHHLAEKELEALALYAGMSGGLRLTSDHLGELSPRRMQLWKLITGWSGEPSRFPFLGRSPLHYDLLPEAGGMRLVARMEDPVIVQVREVQEGLQGEGAYQRAVFVLNSGEEAAQHRYALQELGLSAPVQAREWPDGELTPVEEYLEVQLEPHEGKLFLLRG